MKKERKTIALIAHDGKKAEMVAFVHQNKKKLAAHSLIGTATSSKLIEKETGLKIKAMLSGPQGGDLQIGSLVATNKVDMVIFFRDPLTAQAHDPDITALLRVCDVHNVAIASNPAGAKLFLKNL